MRRGMQKYESKKKMGGQLRRTRMLNSKESSWFLAKTKISGYNDVAATKITNSKRREIIDLGEIITGMYKILKSICQ